jgi:proton-dependent oligopeptide transporter, POT family
MTTTVQAVATPEIHNKQPKAFYLLLFVEFWERFGYYGVQAILVLYVSKALNFTDNQAYETFGGFSALMYIAPLLGGYLADKFIGYQRGLITGLCLLMLGYTTLAAGHSAQLLFLGLTLVVVGCGFFKTCPVSLLGKIYGPDDPRMESSYTLFYMSVNIGGLISMALSGYIITFIGWQAGFDVCAAGLLLAALAFLYFRKLLANVGADADRQPLNKRLLFIIAASTLILLFVFMQLLQHLVIAHWTLAISGVLLIIFYTVMLFRLDTVERNKLIACLVLLVFSIAFWCLYFQMPMTLNLFTDRNVQHSLFGIFFPTSSFQSINPFWIIILAPVLAASYPRLAKHNLNPSIPLKYASGIILVGFAFLLLSLSTHHANAQGIVSSGWVIWSYFLECIAELFIGAISLAMIAKLAPQRLLGMMMGTSFLSLAAASVLSGQLAKLASVTKDQLSPLLTLPVYGHTFMLYGLISIAIGLVTLCFVPFLNRLIKESA